MITYWSFPRYAEFSFHTGMVPYAVPLIPVGPKVRLVHKRISAEGHTHINRAELVFLVSIRRDNAQLETRQDLTVKAHEHFVRIGPPDVWIKTCDQPA